jgi:hypothetical protein
MNNQPNEQNVSQTSSLNEDNVSCINQEFLKIVKEMIPDLLNTFPEYTSTLHSGLSDILTDINSDGVMEVYNHCINTFPKLFFDILYQNEDMFTDATKNTVLLPGIEFADLWKQDISDNTKKILWKYLQLILFSIINDIKDENTLGDTKKLFEAINEDELKQKLEDAMSEMQNIFDVSNQNFSGMDVSNINLDNLPNPEDIHNHMNKMLGGKIGKLAAEIAEEAIKDLDIDVNNVTSVNDVFNKMFRNPGKLMSMVKNVGTTLESKIKSGDIKQSELIQEATDMMANMQSMPGMSNIKSMLGQFGIPMGKNSKLNTGAMQSQLKQNLRQSKMRERMQKRLAERKAMLSMTQNTSITNSTNELPERTPRIKKTVSLSDETTSKKKHKKKKNKRKNKKRK